MKRYIVLLLVLMVASSGWADSWLNDRTDYYPAARIKLGLSTTSNGGLSDTVASQLYNEAAIAILSASRGLKRITTITTSYREDTYALDTTLIGIDAVWWDSVGYVKPLRYVPVELWGQQEYQQPDAGSGDVPLSGRPAFYDYTDSLLLVFPLQTTNRVDTLRVKGWHRLADIDTATTPDIIPEMYRLPILYHMVWNQAKARQDPRVAMFRDELAWSLSFIGLKLTGGQVVPAKN